MASHGFLTVKFNFPYAEGRWRLARKPNPTEVLVECYRRVVEDTSKSEWKPRSIFLGGISMGAAVGSHVIADGPDIPEVKGLIFLSFPIHRPKNPDVPGDKHLSKISRPMIFVAGTKDTYAEPNALKSTVSRLEGRAQIHWIEGADRNLNKRKGKAIYSKTLREIVETLDNWMNSRK